jgi:hypothetical protein
MIRNPKSLDGELQNSFMFLVGQNGKKIFEEKN